MSTVALTHYFALRVVRNDATLAVVHLGCQHGVDVTVSTILACELVRCQRVVGTIIIIIVSRLGNLALVAQAGDHGACCFRFTGACFISKTGLWTSLNQRTLGYI